MSDEHTDPADEATEVTEEQPAEDADAEAPEQTDVTSPDDSESDTFSRSYVEQLRAENAKYRSRAATADELAHRLHTELVRTTGRLADPTDLEFDAEHLDDAEALTAAIDALLSTKPHLATRRPAGDIGQGQRGSATGAFSLLDALKQQV